MTIKDARNPALHQIVGQPPVRHLQSYVDSIKRGDASSRCWGLVGPMGTGKTQTAMAVAAELGCDDVRFSGGLTVVDCSRFGVAACEELFKREVRLSVDTPYKWRVVILEEFERVSKECQTSMKFWLDEKRIASRLCVIATSNDLDGIGAAVLDRFKIMPYSDGKGFMAACQERIKHLWAMARPGCGLPMGMTGWGRSFENDGFSMRSALLTLEESLSEERDLVAA